MHKTKKHGKGNSLNIEGNYYEKKEESSIRKQHQKQVCLLC